MTAVPKPAVRRLYGDLDNAGRLVDAHGTNLRYAPQLGHWLVWDGRRWAEDLKGLVVEYAKDVAEAIRHEPADSADVKELLRHATRSRDRRSIEDAGSRNAHDAVLQLRTSSCRDPG